MSNAPICLIQPVLSDVQPPPVKFPAIPQAVDLRSALAAINAMSMTLRIITGQMSHAYQGQQGERGGTGKAGAAGKPAPKGGRFQEQQANRVVNQIQIASKSDPGTTLTFKRIDGLSFVDTKTGEPWQWSR
jgi:hypothetical protein